jgi:hypothetical protein
VNSLYFFHEALHVHIHRAEEYLATTDIDTITHDVLLPQQTQDLRQFHYSAGK